MPRKNVTRQFYQEGVFHIYNRGIDKRLIFQEKHDYLFFLYLCKKYLSPTFQPKTRWLVNQINEPHFLSKQIDLEGFCLMPNHFHLILKTYHVDAIPNFIRRIITTYSMYFNQKNKRRGSLFEGPYRAVEIKTDEQLVYLSAYIHCNPLAIQQNPFSYPYSSLPYYLGKMRADWVKPTEILDYFKGQKEYRKFIQDYQKDYRQNKKLPTGMIQDIVLD